MTNRRGEEREDRFGSLANLRFLILQRGQRLHLWYTGKRNQGILLANPEISSYCTSYESLLGTRLLCFAISDVTVILLGPTPSFG